MIDMKVFFTIPSIDLRSGGPSKSATSLANALTAFSVQASLATIDTGQELIIEQKANIPYELKLFQTNGTFWDRRQACQRMALELFQELSGSTGSLIHNHGLWLGVNRLAAQLARKTRTPLVISTRGMLEPWALNYRKRKKQLAWCLYQKRDLRTAILLHATAEKEALNLRRLGIKKQPIAVIPNGVDVPRLCFPDKKPSQTRTLLFLSRIHAVKGLATLVDAFNAVRPEGWRVVIAGPDEDGHQQEIQDRIDSARLNEQFEFMGPVYNDRKWQLYNSADLFVLPSFSENFGIVIAEALASGAPVITTKATPWSDLSTHDCGWWIDVGVEPLAKTLKEAITLSDQTRDEMGKRGRELIQRSYSWSKIASDMSGVYEWILGGGAPPSCVMTD